MALEKTEVNEPSISVSPSHWEWSDSPAIQLRIAILIAPGYQPVDIVGVHTAFGLMPGVEMHLVWKDIDEVIGLPTFPTRPTTQGIWIFCTQAQSRQKCSRIKRPWSFWPTGGAALAGSPVHAPAHCFWALRAC